MHNLPTNFCNSVSTSPASTKEKFVSIVSEELQQHFNNRLGQEALLSDAESRLVSNQLWQLIQTLFP